MVRLIVEEGGAHRAFRLGEGVLSVGSTEGRGLVLASPGIADHHLDLAVHAGRVELRPVAGAAVRFAGEPLTGPVALAWNQPVELGQVRLWVDDGQGPVKPPPRGPAAAVVTSSEERERLRMEAITRATRRAPRSQVARRRRDAAPGMPAWAIWLLVLTAGGAVAGLVNFGMRSSTVASETEVTARIAAAREQLANSNFEGALRRLDMIDLNGKVTDEQRQAVVDLRAEIESAQTQVDDTLDTSAGTSFLEVYLKRYEENYLQGRPDPAHVRLFLLRAQEFRERWPDHPEMDWVRRQESRFAGLVDLSAPPTYEDVAWEVSRLVLAAPRNYRRAFELLDELERRAGSEEDVAAHLDDLKALRAKLEAERLEYSEDRLQQAKYEYERRNNPRKAVWWLVHSVIWLGDPKLEDEAAAILVQFPDADQHLRGYADKYPEKYEGLLRNERIRSYAAEHGLPGT